MNQINANLIIAPTRLNRPLPTLYARLQHSFVAAISNIPDDVTSVILRIFKTNCTEYFDIPCGRRPDGTANVNLAGGCFPETGSAKYEIHAYDAKGYMTALGMGYVCVDDFSTTSQPVTPGQTVPLYQIPDANGVMHTVTAVADESGATTIQLD